MPRKVVVVCVAFTLFIPAAIAAQGPGSLDKSFNGDGRLVEHIADGALARDVFVMEDGRILVAGETSNGLLVARYSPHMHPDKSWSGNGRLITKALDAIDRTFVVRMRDGTVLVVSTQHNADNDFAILRLSHTGKIKHGFGDNGVLSVDFGGDDTVRNIALAPNGKLYAIGYDPTESAIARFNMDGTLDTNSDSDPGKSWGEDGKVTTEGYIGLGVRPLKHGKVLSTSDTASYDLVLARFLPDGTPDTAYHGDGTTQIETGPNISHIEIHGFGPGGIVVGANVTAPSGDDVRVIRVTLGGDLVSDFGMGGRKVIDLGGDEYASVPLLDELGRPIIVGERFHGLTSKWFIVRLKKNGKRDGNFGKDGVSFVRFFPKSPHATADPRAAEIQPNGRLVLAGEAGKNDEDFNAAFARLLTK